jgi:hypothetical protein
MSLLNLFKKKAKAGNDRSSWGRGILVFSNTSEVIRSEQVIKGAGFEIRVMGPPPQIRSGCDLVIEFPLIEELNILRLLRDSGIHVEQVVPVTDHLLKPVDLFAVKELGYFLIVRAANMKITVDKRDTMIVNISGGGCPDVPYLAREMIGKSLTQAPSPGDIGHTLCGYALQLAYEEAIRRCLV